MEESHQGNGGNYEASGAGKTREIQTDDDDWILGLPKFIGTCFTGNNNHPPLSQTQKTHDLLSIGHGLSFEFHTFPH